MTLSKRLFGGLIHIIRITFSIYSLSFILFLEPLFLSILLRLIFFPFFIFPAVSFKSVPFLYYYLYYVLLFLSLLFSFYTRPRNSIGKRSRKTFKILQKTIYVQKDLRFILLYYIRLIIVVTYKVKSSN